MGTKIPVSNSASRKLNRRQVLKRDEVVMDEGARAGFYVMAKEYKDENKP